MDLQPETNLANKEKNINVLFDICDIIKLI